MTILQFLPTYEIIRFDILPNLEPPKKFPPLPLILFKMEIPFFFQNIKNKFFSNLKTLLLKFKINLRNSKKNIIQNFE